jgi:hypothetical protein
MVGGATLAAAAALATAAAAAPASSKVTATDVCGVQPGHPVERIVVRIQFHADPNSTPPVTPQQLQKFAQTFAIQAETLFNTHHYTVGGDPLQLEVTASVLPPGGAPQPDAHQIAITDSPNTRSGVVGLGKPGAGPLTGEWSLGYIGSSPSVGLHEIGHLLGFEDQYHDMLQDGLGREAPVPSGMKFNNDGSIQNRDAFASYISSHHLDATTTKGISVPDDGHANDLMGTTKNPNATFEQASLRSLSAFEHHCDPPPPKYLVPVFPASVSKGCSSARTFHPITDTPWPQLALPRYRRAFKPPLECSWQRELAAERSLVDFAIDIARAAGDIRTEAGNTCDVGQMMDLYHMFDQLYNNERNAIGEAAKRSEGVVWAMVHRRTGYTQANGLTIHKFQQFGNNLRRSEVTWYLISGADHGSCVDDPAAGPTA